MATLIVGAVTVAVAAASPPSRQTREYGDFTPAFDGSDRGVLVARKRTWTVRTAPMLQSVADALEAAVLATPPLTASGTVTNASVSVRGTITGYDYVTVRGGLRIVMTFTLTEV